MGSLLNSIAGRFRTDEELEQVRVLWHCFSHGAKLRGLKCSQIKIITIVSSFFQLTSFVNSDEIVEDLVSAGNTAIATAQDNVDWVNTYKADFYRYYGLTDDVTTTDPITDSTSTDATTTTTSTEATTVTTDAPTTPGGAVAISSSVILTLIVVLVNNYYFN